VKTEDTETLGR